MGSLFARSEARREVWSVSDLTSYIREMFDTDYLLQEVQVSGELSNFGRARSGHLYFTLKDANSQLACVMWQSSAAHLRFEPKDGDAVVIVGRVSVYEAGGRYQLYAERIMPVGRGDLAAAFEQLKARLEAEGLFDAQHKKQLPRFPRKIGIVTSIDAAALRDILNVIRRRYPLVQVLIAPTLVQGSSAPPQIAQALGWLDGRNDIDLIVVARGGGSLEDLWAFNDESVARAIFAARHPVICGVGHETDFTIADFVADLRAPTPSAAAELAVPDQRELHAQLEALTGLLTEGLNSRLTQAKWQVDSLLRNLKHLGPERQLMNDRQRVDSLAARLEQTVRQRLARASSELALAEAGLSGVSPLATLSRGYAIIEGASGSIVRSITQVQPGERLRVQVADGMFGADVVESDNERTA